MSPESLTVVEIRAVRVRVIGRVQGLGVRPAAARLAERLKLVGSAANTADGVLLELEGPAAAVDRYLTEFADALPSGAVIEQMLVEPDHTLESVNSQHGFPFDFRFGNAECHNTPNPASGNIPMFYY